MHVKILQNIHQFHSVIKSGWLQLVAEIHEVKGFRTKHRLKGIFLLIYKYR